jgi:peptidyl-prolyl cis-trans isomerase SurA
MQKSRIAPSRPVRRLVVAPFALAAFCSAAACGGGSGSKPAASAASENTWATVDGREITRDFVEKAFRRSEGSTQPMSDEEAIGAKMTLLNDLILQDILMAKAGALKVEVPAADLDAAFNQAKGNMPEEQFNQELTKRNVTAADMKEGLRREMLTQKLLEKEVQSKVTITDQEVSAFFEANKAQFNFPEEAYRIAQIVVTPVREQQQTNRSGNDAATPEQALSKANQLMAQL